MQQGCGRARGILTDCCRGSVGPHEAPSLPSAGGGKAVFVWSCMRSSLVGQILGSKACGLLPQGTCSSAARVRRPQHHGSVTYPVHKGSWHPTSVPAVDSLTCAPSWQATTHRAYNRGHWCLCSFPEEPQPSSLHRTTVRLLVYAWLTCRPRLSQLNGE